MQKDIDIFLYVYGKAAGNDGCEKGPVVLQTALQKACPEYHFHPAITTHSQQRQKDALNDVATLSSALATSTEKALLQNHLVITLGGDHTTAIGSWSGALNALSGDLGLIWFDAHMDAHTFETTPSNNIHGMPLAVLLGHGDPVLTKIAKNSLKPQNLVLIGIRSYEPGEEALLKKLGVTIFYMHDIERLGMKKVFSEAVRIVSEHTAGFGISVDLDGFDPQDAPGVGTSEDNGVFAQDFLAHFSIITQHPDFIGMDIVEFNPNLDKDDKTAQLALKLCTLKEH